MRPKARSTPRSTSSDRNPSRILLASTCSGPYSSMHASDCSRGSASSTTSQPPGVRRPARALATSVRRGRWTRRSRACTRSNGPSGSGSAVTSWRATVTWGGTVPSGQAESASHEVSISVTRTPPVSPTRPDSHEATPGPPAPTSQQRHPGLIPVASSVRNVAASNSSPMAASRTPASACRLSSRYPDVDAPGDDPPAADDPDGVAPAISGVTPRPGPTSTGSLRRAPVVGSSAARSRGRRRGTRPARGR